jgi:hypothetical protein
MPVLVCSVRRVISSRTLVLDTALSNLTISCDHVLIQAVKEVLKFSMFSRELNGQYKSRKTV